MDRGGGGDEVIAGLGARIVFRRIGREIKDLDFFLVLCQPVLNRLRVTRAASPCVIASCNTR